jgi:CRISPR/Cas system endoribonuclease Cas6 (RAMP superfamily)
VRKGRSIRQSILTFWTAPSTWSDRFPSGFVRKIVQLHSVRPFSKRFCTKNRTTPFGPTIFQAVLYEKSYNSERSGRFPSGFVRKIVQLHSVRPFSNRSCTKYRTTPLGPAVFQAVLYEISYNSTRSGRFSSGFVRNIVQLHSVRC